MKCVRPKAHYNNINDAIKHINSRMFRDLLTQKPVTRNFVFLLTTHIKISWCTYAYCSRLIFLYLVKAKLSSLLLSLTMLIIADR